MKKRLKIIESGNYRRLRRAGRQHRRNKNNMEKITLRQALRQAGWESFTGCGESWNVSDLLNEVLAGDSPEWLDAEAEIYGDYIIDAQGDTLREA